MVEDAQPNRSQRRHGFLEFVFNLELDALERKRTALA